MDEEDKKVEYLAANHEERDPTRSRQREASITSVVLNECVHAHRDSKLFCGNSVNVNLNIFF